MIRLAEGGLELLQFVSERGGRVKATCVAIRPRVEHEWLPVDGVSAHFMRRDSWRRLPVVDPEEVPA